MKEHHKYLVRQKGKNAELSNDSIEKIEEIRKKTIEEQSDQIYMFRIYIFLTIYLPYTSAILLGLLCYKLFSKFPKTTTCGLQYYELKLSLFLSLTKGLFFILDYIHEC